MDAHGPQISLAATLFFSLLFLFFLSLPGYNVNFYTYTAMMFIAFTVIGTTVYRHDIEAARQKGIKDEKEAQAAMELQEMGGPSRI